MAGGEEELKTYDLVFERGNKKSNEYLLYHLNISRSSPIDSDEVYAFRNFQTPILNRDRFYK